MSKKKVVFLATMGFDSSILMIKPLRQKYDMYFVFMSNEGKSDVGDLANIKDINRGDSIPQLNIVKDYIDLTKTFLVKHYIGLTYKKFTTEIKVLNLIRKITPDIILTNCANLNMWLCRMIYRKRCISMIHDPFPHTGEDTFGRKLANKMLVKWGQRIILFNKNQKKEFIDFFHVDTKKIYCSFLGQYEYLTLFNDGKRMLPQEDDKLKVLFTGRISPYKGIKYLYDATRLYLEKYKDIHVVIAGKGKLDFDYSGIDEKHLTVYNRFIESDELYSLIDWCDIVVCPYTDATQSGVIMSAYALHKPVLATNVGGLPEMLMNGKLGILVPPKDSNALCDALIDIRNNKDCLKKYSGEVDKAYFNNGPRSWEKAVKIICEAIDSLGR